MKLDTNLLVTYLLVAVRCGAMVATSPLFGNRVPMNIKACAVLVFSLVLTPVAAPFIHEIPSSLPDLLFALLREVGIGILIGLSIQFVMLAAQMAGAFLDLQVGFSMAQTLNPVDGFPASILANYKYLLAVILLLLMNGHAIMFQAFLKSYEVGAMLSLNELPALREHIVTLTGRLFVLSLQMAAPVAAVCVIVDAATGLINKAVPQMQAYLVSIPAKIVVGVGALSIALPLMVATVQSGVEISFEQLLRIFSISSQR